MRISDLGAGQGALMAPYVSSIVSGEVGVKGLFAAGQALGCGLGLDCRQALVELRVLGA